MHIVIRVTHQRAHVFPEYFYKPGPGILPGGKRCGLEEHQF